MRNLLETPFLGTRQYVHGTSLFNAIEGTLRRDVGDDTHIKNLTIRHMATRTCALLAAEDDPDGHERLVANVMYWNGSQFLKGKVVETDQQIENRIPYPEDKIVRGSLVDGECIRQCEPSGYTVIEEIVALTKKLHYRTQPQPDGQWVFINIDLDRPLHFIEYPFQVEIVRKLGGKLTSSVIICNGEIVGRIQFGVK